MAKAKAPKKADKPDGRPSKRSVRTIEIAGSLPCDLDEAGVALEQAASIIDVLTASCIGIELPDTYPGALVGALHAAHAMVKRADEALFGKGAA